MPRIIGNVELYMGPHQTGALDNLEETIVDFINGAQSRLEVAVQELDSPKIAEALIRARQRKVTMKVVTEHSYLIERPPVRQPDRPGGKYEANRSLHASLLRANIDVKTDYNTDIFHQKFIVRDRQSLLTGSTNFTETGTSRNLNHIVIVHDSEVAKIYAREFREISQGHFGKLSEGHDKSPNDVIVSGIPIRVLFAPDHNPEMEIMKQMAKAKRSIDFAIFTFSNSSGIDDQMLLIRRLNMPIRGAMDFKQGVQKWAATDHLVNAGVEIYTVKPSRTIGKLHHKLMVLDEQVIIAGSFNYTGPANKLNDENIIILGDLDSTENHSIALQKEMAGYALEEINRIMDIYGERYPVG
jgi:phosphatidylserine/phosphatidylglycerophosphate/cardiolipin synthase-like enzyme